MMLFSVTVRVMRRWTTARTALQISVLGGTLQARLSATDLLRMVQCGSPVSISF